jgi:acylphosphatase
MKVRAHVFVSGRVQGVLFRAETMNEAERNHVTGWVRNMRDGRVEAIFEGEEQDVDKMIEFCTHGSPAARVMSVEVNKELYSGKYTRFEAL